MIRHLIFGMATLAATSASAQELPLRFSVTCRGTSTYTALPPTPDGEVWTYSEEGEMTWLFDRENSTIHRSPERAAPTRYCSPDDGCHVAFGSDVIASTRQTTIRPRRTQAFIYSRRDDALHIVTSAHPNYVESHYRCDAPVALSAAPSN